MPEKAAKQANIQQLHMVFNGGLNYVQSSANIQDNEVKRAVNFLYDPMTDNLITRPGTVCQTTSALPSPITKGFYYEVSSTEAYHVCAAGTKLYYLSGASLDAWTEIGTDVLTGTYVPSFVVFNNLLYIADGAAGGLKTWNGAVLGVFDTTITDSPPATALTVIKNRLVANSVTDLDLVTFSAPNDASDTGWNTSTTAVALRAGYGDRLNVNAFGVFGDDLVVSKTGAREKRLYRINVADATTSNWYVQDLSQNNAAQSARTMIGAWNNVFFVDTNGFKSVKGTESYGDLEVDPMGRKINSIFQEDNDADMIAYLPSYNAIWFSVGSRIFCYTERYDPQTGKNIPAFTDLYFTWDRCTSAYEVGEEVYLTGWDGYLHKLDTGVSTDETTPGVTATFVAAVRSKTFTFFTDALLKKLQWYLNPKSAGTGNMYLCTEEETKTRLKQFTIDDEGVYLYDETGELNVALDELYATGSSSWIETTRNRIRDEKMAFEIELTSGRCGIQWCKAEVALLEGGD